MHFHDKFIKSSISLDMFGKIFVVCFKFNDVLEIRQVPPPSTVLFKWFTVLLMKSESHETRIGMELVGATCMIKVQDIVNTMPIFMSNGTN